MLYITGDTHANFHRFANKRFKPIFGDEFTSDDIVVICGDFGGVWDDTPEERYWLNWLSRKPYQIAFVDGNHENFDLLSGFPVVDYHGGRAHEIRPNIHHLMRGELFDLCGKKVFAFGGASSHDIADGVLDPSDDAYKAKLAIYNLMCKQYRVLGKSWWPQELPTEEEMQHGIDTLNSVGFKVDYVISHCLPQEIASVFSMGLYKSDVLTLYFNGLLQRNLKFDHWFCGHYHIDRDIMGKFHILYENITTVPDIYHEED